MGVPGDEMLLHLGLGSITSRCSGKEPAPRPAVSSRGGLEKATEIEPRYATASYFGREGLGRQRRFMYGNGVYSLYVSLQSDTFKETRNLILLPNEIGLINNSLAVSHLEVPIMIISTANILFVSFFISLCSTAKRT